MKKFLKRFFIPAAGTVLLLILSITVFRYYRNYIGVTRIAFVNYSSFQLARIERSNRERMIKVISLSPEDIGDIRRYDAVFVFGRGLDLDEEQSRALKNAAYTGLPVFVESANNPNLDVTNLKGRDLDLVTDYFRYGGTENYTNLLRYTRAILDHKTWWAPQPEPPREISKDVLFYLDESLAFNTVPSFRQYAVKQGIHRRGQPSVVLLTSVPGPFNSNRDHFDTIIRAMEKQHWNIYPVASISKRLEWLKEIKPDLVVMMPHGRLSTGMSAAALSWLKSCNVPVLTPLSVFRNYDDWMKDPQGMSGSLLSMNIALPELDGAIVPYVVAAQFKDKQGYDVFKAIPGRLEKFCRLAQKYIDLKRKPNSQKKIAIYYFKGPGMQSMTASNLEVVPSLYHTLKRLKAEGYRVDNLPASEKDLWKIILKSGSILAPYAEGAMDRFCKEGNPAWVSAGEFSRWEAEDLSKRQQQDIKNKYGSFPGTYMSAVKEGRDYLAVARIQFGNIVLLPQPLPAVGNNTFKLIHGAKVAPPYPYVASYLWTRHAFGADAVIHFGTHGSLEFTPGKQVALSDEEWSDALTGTVPHIYLYTVSNVGEAIIAKRRTYATMISHLTAPFMKAGTYGGLAELEQDLHKWKAFDSGLLKEEYGKTISVKALKLGLYRDLNAGTSKTLNHAQLTRLAALIEEIDNEKVTSGLYTIGKPYSAAEVNNTVTRMTADAVAYNLAKLDIVKGLEKSAVLDDPVLFTARYRNRAEQMITRRLQGGGSRNTAPAVLAEADLHRAEKWLSEHPAASGDAIIRGFIAMADAPGQKPGAKKEYGFSSGAMKQSEDLVVKILPYPPKVAFIQSLRSDKRMKEATSLLDPTTLDRAKTIARAIPKMQEAITISQDRNVKALLRLMQKDSVRLKVFEMLNDPRLATRVEEEKVRIAAAIRKKATGPEIRTSLAFAVNGNWKTAQVAALRKLKADLIFVNGNRKFLSNIPSESLISRTISEIDQAIAAKEEKERQFAEAAMGIKNSLENISYYRQALANSTEAELQSLVNALNGGFTAPSPGGDPVYSPSAVPTGRNLVSTDPEKTPSEEAWRVGVKLGESLLENHFRQHHAYPKKVSFTLWSGDFIQTEGAMIAQIFYLLGAEPVRDPLNRVQDVRLIPASRLARPRIDVVVQTSGQFRDLAASRISLINKAVALAAAAGDSGGYCNYVSDGVSLSEKSLKERGFSPKDARELSALRVFGGIDGAYGTGIMDMVEKSDQWNKREEIAETYLNNMGAVYGDGGKWAYYRAGVFESALQNTEVVVQPRSSNTWGPLSLDHVYEFMGGMNLTVKKVTGKDPDTYFSDFRNPANARMQDGREAVWVEARSTLLNPAYIREMLNGGPSAAGQFAETFRNAFGWSVMKQDMISQELWNQLHDTYVKDKLKLGVGGFFRKENPYALQEMTGIMLEAHRKGLWKASADQLSELARQHSDLILTYGAGCSEFICGNTKLKEEVLNRLDAATGKQYMAKLDGALLRSSATQNGTSQLLKKDGLGARHDNENPESHSGNPKYRWPELIGGLLAVLAVVLFVLWKRRR